MYVSKEFCVATRRSEEHQGADPSDTVVPVLCTMLGPAFRGAEKRCHHDRRGHAAEGASGPRTAVRFVTEQSRRPHTCLLEGGDDGGRRAARPAGSGRSLRGGPLEVMAAH